MAKYLLYGFFIYLAAINIVAFFLYGIDKWKARHDKWRVTESRLITIALAAVYYFYADELQLFHSFTP